MCGEAAGPAIAAQLFTLSTTSRPIPPTPPQPPSITTMDATLDKVATAIDTAQPKIEKAIESTLGAAAAGKAHDLIEKVEEALKNPVRARGGGRAARGERARGQAVHAAACGPL